MKQLVCEMCGSTDLLKDGGVFVCQSCGCKYTVEEARKMMVEGVVEVQGTVSIDNTVDVQGTVQVDNTANVERYLANARRAKEKQDWEEVEKYYNMVEQNDPDNIEAIFYSAYAKARQSLLDGDIFKREAAFKVLENCISVIDDHYQISRGDENRAVIEGMAKDLIEIMTCNFANRANTKAKTSVLFAGLIRGFAESIGNIARVDDHAYLHQCVADVLSIVPQIEWPTLSSSLEIAKSTGETRRSELAKVALLEMRFNEAYWLTHASEYEGLISERDEVSAKMEQLRESIEMLPESTRLAGLKEDEASLKARLSGLGMFKGKEKAAIRSQLETLATQIKQADQAKNEASSDIEREIEACAARSAEIDAQLAATKPEMPGDLYAEFSARQTECREAYFTAHPDKKSEFDDAEKELDAAFKAHREALKELGASNYASKGKQADAQKKVERTQKRLDEAKAARDALAFDVYAALRSDEYVQTKLSQYGD